ncbi:MAG: hypothetical protein HUK20_09120, partial [Fibrobacter sp.]|nr:hypothetical protein [Fibrobacter sp.]
MRNTAKFLLTVLATMAASVAMADEIPAAMNPANGVWIQQIGDVVPHDGTKATLYYTRYDQDDRVRSITYQYNGNGYLLIKPGDKTTICKKGANGVEGSDGIVHMPNSPHLLIAGQTKGEVYKVRKNATGQCRDA